MSFGHEHLKPNKIKVGLALEGMREWHLPCHNLECYQIKTETLKTSPMPT